MKNPSFEVTVFDEHTNRPGSNVVVYLDKMTNGSFCPVSRSQADLNGNCSNLVRKGYLITTGLCQLKIDLNSIFAEDVRRFTFPYICIHFWTTGETTYTLTIRVILHESSYTVQFSKREFD